MWSAALRLLGWQLWLQGAEDGCWHMDGWSPLAFPSPLRVQNTPGLHTNPLFKTLWTTKEILELSQSPGLDQGVLCQNDVLGSSKSWPLAAGLGYRKSYRLLKKRFWTVLLVCTEDVTHARLWSTMAAIRLFYIMSCLLQYSCLCRSREVRISLFSIFLIVTIVSVFDTIFCFLSPDIFSWLDEVLIFF